MKQTLRANTAVNGNILMEPEIFFPKILNGKYLFVQKGTSIRKLNILFRRKSFIWLHYEHNVCNIITRNGCPTTTKICLKFGLCYLSTNFWRQQQLQ